MRFSERRGLKPARLEVARDCVDDDTRIALWNLLYLVFMERTEKVAVRDILTNADHWVLFWRRVWMHVLGRKLTELPYNWSRYQTELHDWYFAAKWYEILDLLEHIAREDSAPVDIGEYVSLVNDTLEEYVSAFRIIGDTIAEITSEEERASVQDAVDASPSPVQAHLKRALELLSDREQPDYRNSIKESISAVESMCRILSGDTNATLGKALRRLKDGGVKLHPALENAWSGIYGFTSDADGVRHSMMQESGLTQSDARYMLVSCSAFVNHLSELARYAGVELRDHA